VEEEYRTIRPAYRGGDLVGLAPVTASADGYDMSNQPRFRAPGYAEACRLLGVDAQKQLSLRQLRTLSSDATH
jgi:hypothetical protein